MVKELKYKEGDVATKGKPLLMIELEGEGEHYLEVVYSEQCTAILSNYSSQYLPLCKRPLKTVRYK